MINLHFCCLRQSYCYQILSSCLIQPFLKQWKAWKLLWQKTSYPSKHFSWSVQKYAKNKQEKMLQQWTQILHYLHQSFHLIHLQSFHCSQLSSLKEPLLQATSLSQDPMDHTDISLWEIKITKNQTQCKIRLTSSSSELLSEVASSLDSIFLAGLLLPAAGAAGNFLDDFVGTWDYNSKQSY